MKELISRGIFGNIFLLFVFTPYFLDLNNGTNLFNLTLFIFALFSVYELFVMEFEVKKEKIKKENGSFFKNTLVIPALLFSTFLFIPIIVNVFKGIYPNIKNIQLYSIYQNEYVQLIFVVIVLLSIAFFSYLIFTKKELTNIFNATFFLSIFYVTIPLLVVSILLSISDIETKSMLFVILLCIYMNDTFAYISGRLFGKNKMFPSVSPKKTWEGFIGGILVTAITICILIFIRNQEENNGILFVLGILVSVATSILATLGDFWESKLKRTAGVKDSGKILPGHGGILDRIDAMLFAVPVLYILLYFI